MTSDNPSVVEFKSLSPSVESTETRWLNGRADRHEFTNAGLSTWRETGEKTIIDVPLLLAFTSDRGLKVEGDLTHGKGIRSP